jgi:hypothetical protein
MSCGFQRKFLRPRWVVSDEGFEVRFLGMTKVRYSEGERSVWFWAEPVIIVQGEFKGQGGWQVALSKPSRWSNGMPLEEAEQKLVQDRTRDALEFMHVPYVEI